MIGVTSSPIISLWKYMRKQGKEKRWCQTLRAGNIKEFQMPFCWWIIKVCPDLFDPTKGDNRKSHPSVQSLAPVHTSIFTKLPWHSELHARTTSAIWVGSGVSWMVMIWSSIMFWNWTMLLSQSCQSSVLNWDNDAINKKKAVTLKLYTHLP